MNAPCRNCAERRLGCHGVCLYYLTFRKVLDEAGARRQADRDQERLLKDGKRRMMRRVRKKNPP